MIFVLKRVTFYCAIYIHVTLKQGSRHVTVIEVAGLMALQLALFLHKNTKIIKMLQPSITIQSSNGKHLKVNIKAECIYCVIYTSQTTYPKKAA